MRRIRRKSKLTPELALKRLEKHCPVAKPVTVRRQKLTAVWGYCEETTEGYNIVIASGIRVPQAVETLVHEWAHALVWDCGGADHGAYWGVAYAQCYTAVYGG